MKVRGGHCGEGEVKWSRKADREAGGFVLYEQVICLGGSQWLKGQRKVRCQVNVTGKWVWACSWDFYGLYAKREAKGETGHSVWQSVWQQSWGGRLQPTGIQSSGQNSRLNIMLLWKLDLVCETNQIISQLCHWWWTRLCFVKDQRIGIYLYFLLAEIFSFQTVIKNISHKSYSGIHGMQN